MVAGNPGLTAAPSRAAGVLSREAEVVQATRVPGLPEGARATTTDVSQQT